MKYIVLLILVMLASYEYGRFSAFMFTRYIFSRKYTKTELDVMYWTITIIEMVIVAMFAHFVFDLFKEVI